MKNLDVLVTQSAVGVSAPQRGPSVRVSGAAGDGAGEAGATDFASVLSGDEATPEPDKPSGAEEMAAGSGSEVEQEEADTKTEADDRAAVEATLAVLVAQSPDMMAARAMTTAPAAASASSTPTTPAAGSGGSASGGAVPGPVGLVGDGNSLPLPGGDLPHAGGESPQGQQAADEPFEPSRREPGLAPELTRGVPGAPPGAPSGATSATVEADLPGALLAPAGEGLSSDTSAAQAPAAPLSPGARGDLRSGAALLAALPLPAPGVPGFEAAFSQRLIWMASHGVQDALVRVHPDHLGPVDIHIRVSGESAELALAASHAGARDALEAALPRLREQLGEAGLQLVRAEVTGQHPREGGARGGSPTLPEARPSGDEAEAEALMDRRITGRAGLLDLFV